MAGQRMALSLPFYRRSFAREAISQSRGLFCSFRTSIYLNARCVLPARFQFRRNLMAEASQDLEGPDFEKGLEKLKTKAEKK